MSCLITFLPALSFISDGFRIIICAVVASVLGAWLLPPPLAEEQDEGKEALD